MSNKPNPNEKSDALRSANAYLRYSGLAIQMGVLIGLGAWLGLWLDGKWQTGKLFTVICSLSALALSMYQLIREVMPPNQPKK